MGELTLEAMRSHVWSLTICDLRLFSKRLSST